MVRGRVIMGGKGVGWYWVVGWYGGRVIRGGKGVDKEINKL